MNIEKSKTLFSQATRCIPGGVNSPVRACNSVKCEAVFIERGESCWLYDADGNRYLDFVCSWGPMILGHQHPAVSTAIKEALDYGTSFGAPTSKEITLAQLVCEAMPSIEKVRFVSSGTEATMSAVRLARGYTGKNRIIKFDGCYHGHADSFLIKAGSGVMSLGIPGSPGVPEDIVKNTASIPYNDIDILEKTLRGDKDIACVIVEPVAGNMGVVPPAPGFLQSLRSLCSELGIVLIFDEVITGFRLAKGGAQEYYGVKADLTCLGKIIGGGLPVGAYGGKKEIMDQIAPDGPVYQAGTLSGNPLAMAAGIATLKELARPGFYQELEEKSAFLAEGLIKLGEKHLPEHCTLNRVGSMMTVFFTPDKVIDHQSATKSDTGLYACHYRNMREQGVWLAPAQFEAMFVSGAHEKNELELALEKSDVSLKKIARELKTR